MGDATDLCTLAKGDARSVVNGVAKQLRAMGYKPDREICEKPTEKAPENCYVQVVFGDSQALTFLAFPHLLPNPPLRFEGVDTVLAVSKQ